VVGLGLTLVAMSALVAGCGSSDSSTKAAASTTTAARPGPLTTTTLAPIPSTTLAVSVPAGFVGFTDAADRFTIAVPTAWSKVDPSSPGAAQATQEMLKNNPDMATVLTSDLAGQGVKYLAVDGSGSSANVVVKPALGMKDSDLPQVADAVKAQYLKVGGTVRGTETVQFAGHTALRLTVDLKLARAVGSRVTVRTIQYFMALNDLAYIVTLAGTSPLLVPIGDTFRVS